MAVGGGRILTPCTILLPITRERESFYLTAWFRAGFPMLADVKATRAAPHFDSGLDTGSAPGNSFRILEKQGVDLVSQRNTRKE